MWDRARNTAVAVCGLLAAGIALQPLGRALERAGGRSAAPWRERGAGAVLGGSLIAAVFGGLRGLAADGLWLRTYAAWARRDLPATGRLIHLVTLVDERPLDFWINGARMLAYDTPHWRLVAGGDGQVGAVVRRRIIRERAAVALKYLDEGRRFHPGSAALCIEAANIHLNLTGDLEAATRWYREAAGKANAPRYAARIYAELLCRQGRYREAHAWLCALCPSLPAGDPDAMRGVILRRIAALEDLLAIPAERRYKPLKKR